MRSLTLLFILLFPSFALACEGYNNAMNALESAIEHSGPNSKLVKTSGPPINDINAVIGDLETAIENHNAQTPAAPVQQSYPRRQKPRL